MVFSALLDDKNIYLFNCSSLLLHFKSLGLLNSIESFPIVNNLWMRESDESIFESDFSVVPKRRRRFSKHEEHQFENRSWKKREVFLSKMSLINKWMMMSSRVSNRLWDAPNHQNNSLFPLAQSQLSPTSISEWN